MKKFKKTEIINEFSFVLCNERHALVFAMCHNNYISSWEVSFCCGSASFEVDHLLRVKVV